MNRKIACLAILLMLLAAIGCGTNPHVRHTLGSAEALMDERPDSALALLEALDPADISSSKEKALYALLLTQAHDKNYIEDTSDSLISTAVDYYSLKNDAYNLMLSLFYHGMVKENARSYPQAIVLFSRSMDIAESLDDYFWMGKNAEQISTIYDLTHRREEAVRYARLAHKCYSMTDRQPFIDFSLLEIARIELNARHYKTAYQVADSACRFVLSDSDAYLRGHAMDVMGEAAFFMKDYPQAIALLRPVYEDTESTYVASLLGMAYILSGDIGSAAEIFNAMPQDSNGAAELNFMLKYQQAAGLAEKSAATRETLMALLDSIYTENLNENFIRDLNDLRKQDATAAELRLSYKRVENAVLLLGLAICLIAVAFAAYCIRRRIALERAKTNHAIEAAQDLEEMLARKNLESEALGNALGQTRLQHIKDIASMSKGLDIDGIHASTNTSKRRFVTELRAVAESLTADEQLELMENEARAKHAGVLDRLDAELGGMRRKDRMLYLFCIMGFSIPTIAFLLNEDSLEPIYNRRARLKRQIKQLPNPSEYLKYLEIKD